MTTRILFVCLGNICRSPAAEGVFRHLATEAGLADRFTIDSAGTGAWHVGEPADRRMRQAAERRGITLSGTARPVIHEDFDRFDHILAMDADNARVLRRLAPASRRDRIRLFRDYDPEGRGRDVPDPYSLDADAFEDVLDIVMRTSQALLIELGGPPA
jgi:protein-tyrosine phosphatase